MQNEQNRMDEARPAAGPDAAVRGASSRRVPVLGALALLMISGIGGGYLILRNLPANGCACEAPEDGPSAHDDPFRKPILFPGWGQPELAIVVSGQMHGYMFPCGCSEPQHGGLVRRLVFIDSLKAKGWDVVGVDLGELPPTPGTAIPRQRELKLEYTMKALDIMGYKAVGLGKTEMAMPLVVALSQYSLNKATPRPINATLAETWQKGAFAHAANARPFEILPGTPRVGVASLVGPDLEDELRAQDKNLKFINNKSGALPQIFHEFANQKVDMAVLLHHEYPTRNGAAGNPLKMDRMRRDMAETLALAWEAERQQAAKKGALAIPPLQLLMILTEEPEPPAVLQAVPGTPTQILEIGHKGKYVGVVGVFRQPAGGLQLKYELVRMDPGYEPLPGQKNKVLDLFEEYAKQVKNENLLKDYIRSPHPIQVDNYVINTYGGSRYIGSDACAECHVNESMIWGKSKHATQAFKVLENKKNPSLRQFDPECIICHTTGYKHPEGYNELPRFMIDKLANQKAGPAQIQKELVKHNHLLANMGCENCHGPGSAHRNNPNDKKLHALMNPYRPSDAEKKWAAEAKNGPNAAVRQHAADEAKALFNRRMDRLDDFCQKCHDLENDVNWAKVPFLQKWVGGGIVHNRADNVGNPWLKPPAPPAAAGR